MSGLQKPRVPTRYSALMPHTTQEGLRRSQARSNSAASGISSRSTVSEFLEAKIEEIDGELEYVTHYYSGLKDTLATQTLTKGKFEEELETLEENTRNLQKELTVIKRQRKTLEEDLAEKPNTKQIEDAYTASMMERVMAAQ